MCRKLVMSAVMTVMLCTSAFSTVYVWDVASGNWSMGTNWDPAGPPTASDDAANLSNGGTIMIDTDTATINGFGVYYGTVYQSSYSNNNNYLSLGIGATGTYNLSGGVLNSGTILLGVEDNYSVQGSGYLNIIGGTVNASSMIIGYSAGYGELNISDGTVHISGELILGRGSAMGDAWIKQSGGTINVDENCYISMYIAGMGPTTGHGIYEMDGGSLNVSQNLYVGSNIGNLDGRLLLKSGNIMVAQDVVIETSSYISNAGGSWATIEVWGEFYNNSTANEDFDMTKTTLIMAHGGTGWVESGSYWDATVLDMGAVADMGLDVDGLVDNFAIGSLVFLGSQTSSMWYRLESDIYCTGLAIQEGAIVDLNGHNIYYFSGIPGSSYELNGTIFNSAGPSTLLEGSIGGPVPEPTTIVLIGTGILSLATIVRKKCL